MKENKLKILHILSQRPDSTGSGYYIQAMLKESEENEHDNFLLAGLHSKDIPGIEVIPKDKREFIHFNGHDISYQIVGMSDVMSYESKKFCDLSDEEIQEYESVFKAKLKKVISEYKPDIIHSHHLWILTSLVKRNFPEIPIVASCHGSDIRQFRKCDHLREKVLSGCKYLEGVMALSVSQKKEIVELYGLSEDTIHVVGAGFNEELFTFSEKPNQDPVQIYH
ncbi:MAG: glycosyltransferase family 4 protein [Candidatus Delongbacteria bacterium]|jgi:hypothetical protein|nr:glycosyltransferase family 4 protein [Candidatus Delongbacteria bacterium]